MANSTWDLVGATGDTTTFRIWGLGISSRLDDIGLVKTSDTGQIDWTTVSKPAANTHAGYEVWRFDDALQATAPIFIKMWYGCAALNSPRLQIVFGSITDGAGNLSGEGSDVGFYTPLAGSATATGTHINYLSGDGSGFVLSHAITSSDLTQAVVLVVDRLRNSSGQPTSDGFIVSYKSRQTSNFVFNVFERISPANARRTISSLRGNALLPTSLSALTSSVADDGNIYMSPYYVMIPGGNGVRFSKMILCCAAADFALGTNSTVTHLGESRTYKAMGSYINYTDNRAQQYASLAIWWSD